MISLCTFVKNEAHCVVHMIESVRSYVQDVVVVDTGSSDDTVQVCKALNARVYEVGFTDFGKIRTLASHLARKPWVLMLDADEILSDPQQLADITETGKHSAYAFPRKRWLDLEMTRQTELDAYPDFQVRFYRNHVGFTWERELHEFFTGAAVRNMTGGPVIHHFHDVFKCQERLNERKELYTKLAKRAGVAIEGGHAI